MSVAHMFTIFVDHKVWVFGIAYHYLVNNFIPVWGNITEHADRTGQDGLVDAAIAAAVHVVVKVQTSVLLGHRLAQFLFDFGR